jgi:hypothetical protein
MRGGMGGGMGGSGRNGTGGGNDGRGKGAAGGGRTTSSPGEVDLAPMQGGGQGGGQGGFQMPEVSDKDCAAVKSALEKKPAESKKLDDLREKMRSADADRSALREEQGKIYAALGVDARIAGACRMKEQRGQGGGQFGGNQTGGSGQGRGTTPTGQTGGQRRGSQPSVTGTATGATQAPQLQLGNTERGGTGQRVRSGLVFVAKGKTFEPRVVMLGAGNFDYTEVVRGLEEGDQVALLASLSLQAARQAQNDRTKAVMGGGVPGMSASPGAGGQGGQGGGQRPQGGGGSGRP